MNLKKINYFSITEINKNKKKRFLNFFAFWKENWIFLRLIFSIFF